MPSISSRPSASTMRLPRVATTGSGSPAIFSPHSREVALGLDYWLSPSIVWQSEVDIELPGKGGTLYNFPGSASFPTASPIGTTQNDVAAMTQLTIGF